MENWRTHSMNVLEGEAASEILMGSAHGDESDDPVNVVCPYCKSDYSHIIQAGTLIGSDPCEAASAYPGTVATGVTESRRSAVEILFECEPCGGLFALVIRQHKGHNFVEVHLNNGKKFRTNDDPRMG